MEKPVQMSDFIHNGGVITMAVKCSCIYIICPTYPIEQNRTKNQSNPIELQSFDWVGQSNKIEHLFCCDFDFRTNRTNIIEQNRTKSVWWLKVNEDS